MGSSSRGSSDWQPPAQQGPPISVLNPAQGAPNPQYVNFLPDNNSPATGFTGAMIDALNGRANGQAAPPATTAAATAAASPAATTPGGVTMQQVQDYVQRREQLARFMAAAEQHRGGSSYGGGGGGAGYGSSGRGW